MRRKSDKSRKASIIQRRLRVERILGAAAVVSLLIAWVVGAIQARADVMPAVRSSIPNAGHIEKLSDTLYQGFYDETKADSLGYVTFEEASGYGGPMILAVAVSPKGEIIGVTIASHKETPA